MYKEYPISCWANGEEIILYQSREAEEQYILETVQSNSKVGKRVGYGLISFSVLVFGLLFANQFFPEVKYTFAKAFESQKELRNKTLVQVNVPHEQSEIESLPQAASNDFSLIVPKINLNVKVMANVNPESPKEYKLALKEGVAHAKNSSLPGQEGVTYIFAHSSGYVWNPNPLDTVFYPLSKLEVNDLIYVVYQSKTYKYKVVAKDIAEANNVSFLTSNAGEKKLVLQTCWPPGTNWKRLFITAEPAEFDSNASQTIFQVL